MTFLRRLWAMLRGRGVSVVDWRCGTCLHCVAGTRVGRKQNVEVSVKPCATCCRPCAAGMPGFGRVLRVTGRIKRFMKGGW